MNVIYNNLIKSLYHIDKRHHMHDQLYYDINECNPSFSLILSLSITFIHLPQTKSSNQACGSRHNHRCKDGRHHQVNLGFLKHLSRKTKDFRWNIKRNPHKTFLLILTYFRERRRWCYGPYKCKLWCKGGHRHSGGQNGGPGGGVHQQWPPLSQLFQN